MELDTASGRTKRRGVFSLYGQTISVEFTETTISSTMLFINRTQHRTHVSTYHKPVTCVPSLSTWLEACLSDMGVRSGHNE